MSGRPGLLAGVSLAGTVYFAAAIVALHFLRPDLDAVSQPTSTYAVGEHGWLMTSAFLALMLSVWALVWALATAVAGSWRLRAGLLFLGLCGVGLVVASLFPIDLDGAAPTMAGTVHRINGPLTFLCLTAGVVLVSLGLARDENWRPSHATARLLGFAVLAAFVLGALTIPTGSGFGGAAQRLQLVAVVGWLLFVGFRLRSAGGR